MKKIKLVKWKEQAPNEKGESIEIDQDSINILNMLINSIAPEKQPKGLDNFRMMNKITKAFDKAKGKEYLYLEAPEYKYIKDNALENLPANWGANPNAFAAINNFDNAEDKDVNE